MTNTIETIKITISSARMVMGHPMRRTIKTDDYGQPVLDDEGNPKTQTFFCLAVPKDNATDWKQTAWGQQVYNKALADFPNGDYAGQTFSWKIEDGDSTVPNKNHRKNIEREGCPGHWLIKCTTMLNVKCFTTTVNGQYSETVDENYMKTGDYVNAYLEIRGNGATGTLTRGMYVNPVAVQLARPGQEIITSSLDMDALDAAFGGKGSLAFENPAVTLASPAAPSQISEAPPQTPAVPAPPTSPPQTVEPAPDFLEVPNPPAPPSEDKFNYNGTVYTRSQLQGFKWTDDQINTLPKA